jgi:predicted dehydrogenase
MGEEVQPEEELTRRRTVRHATRNRQRKDTMINAAIVGLGRWGQNLVNSVQGKSDKIRFVAGATRTVAKAKDYAAQQGFPLYDDYAKVLADPAIDAIVLATPHTQHAQQVIAAARAG